MATRTVTSTLKKPDGSAWHGGVVRFRLTPDTFRGSPAETYPEETVLATADASGTISATLVSGADLVYRVTLPGPAGDQFDIAVPDGSATTLEALRAAYSGAPVAVDTVETALLAIYGSPPIGRPALTVQLNDVTVEAETAVLDFSTAFTASESPSGEVNIGLAPIASLAINDLTDVVITDAPADDGEILQSDGTNLVNVRPAPFVFQFIYAPVTSIVWIDMPAAATVFNGDGDYYARLDLTNCRQVSLWVDNAVAGAAGSDIYLRWSTDFSSWVDIAGATTVIATTGGHDSGWVDLPAGAKASNVFIQVWGKDGNGVNDPSFKQIVAQFR